MEWSIEAELLEESHIPAEAPEALRH